MRKNLSQLKRQRQDEKRRLSNRALRSEMRTKLRKAREAIANEPAGEQTKILIDDASRAIDTMVTKGVIHKNTAGRYKSRLILSYRRNLPGETKQGAPTVKSEEIPGPVETDV